MTAKPTLTEMKTEWEYVFQTRLGILCEDREPTPEQTSIAHEEADRAVIAMQGLPPKAVYQPELAGTWVTSSVKEL